MIPDPIQISQDGRLAASRNIFVPMRWRDGWLWDRKGFALVIFVPFICVNGLLVILSQLFPNSRTHLAHFFWLGLIGFPVAVIYASMGVRLRNLKNRIRGDFIEMADCLVAQNSFKSPGVAVLRPESLELVRITGQATLIPFQVISEVRQIIWFNNRKRLFLKMGIEIRVNNMAPMQFAVAYPVGIRWMGVLKTALGK